ncbi:phage baseplate assembly protein V [Micromonospora echinofusca]|uniref:phage baseplate assembly protein V n=1 Tax=Micromonospora echinofusca TaxID=47858 RepID=UPI0033F44F5B
MTTRYYGKYRGTVVNHIDPLQQGRVQVTVPDVTLPPSTWAMPCFPLAGIQAGVFTVPLPGTGVWVEFEQGDADHPIWTGCWYGSKAEIPALVASAPPPTPPIVLQTPGQATLMISDAPGPAGGILLRTLTGAMISINDTGIVISNGKGASVTLIGPTVAVNQTALTVT